jgi:hypothetical protein
MWSVFHLDSLSVSYLEPFFSKNYFSKNFINFLPFFNRFSPEFHRLSKRFQPAVFRPDRTSDFRSISSVERQVSGFDLEVEILDSRMSELKTISWKGRTSQF